MWKHESYDSSIITNDVSLLRLDEPLEFNDIIQPLRMAEKGWFKGTDHGKMKGGII